MNEKDTALLSDDYGRDLASVQALQRKHEGLERDLAALEDKVTWEGGMETAVTNDSVVIFSTSPSHRSKHCGKMLLSWWACSQPTPKLYGGKRGRSWTAGPA